MKTAELVAKLKEKLEEEHFASSETGKLPNIDKMVLEFGTSSSTFMKAIRILEQEGILCSIRGKGVFFADPGKINSRFRVGIAGMYYCPPGQTFNSTFFPYMGAADEYLKRNGCLVSMLDKSDLNRKLLETKMLLRDLDALIILYGCIDPVTIPRLSAWGKPVIVIQQESTLDIPFHQVVPDLKSGFAKAAERIAAKGIRRILAPRLNATTNEARLNFFLQALKENPETAEIPVEILPVKSHVSNDLYRDAGRGFARSIRSPDHLEQTLIFSPGDFFAFGFIEVMNEKKRVCGNDYFLLSCDNIEEENYLPFHTPQLTTVDKQPRAIGIAAAEMAVDLLRRPKGNRYLCQTPTTLVIRKTL